MHFKQVLLFTKGHFPSELPHVDSYVAVLRAQRKSIDAKAYPSFAFYAKLINIDIEIEKMGLLVLVVYGTTSTQPNDPHKVSQPKHICYSE